MKTLNKYHVHKLNKLVRYRCVKLFVTGSFFNLFLSPGGEWADPGGTAIPGQPVARAEQAPDISPSSKNQFNIEVTQWATYQILS